MLWEVTNIDMFLLLRREPTTLGAPQTGSLFTVAIRSMVGL